MMFSTVGKLPAAKYSQGSMGGGCQCICVYDVVDCTHILTGPRVSHTHIQQ